ncbi:hypothetical protein Tco_0843582 [Tanacetum coccineum]|uniref:Uncharacterized protein n=1 Tax=Tanacetum coccineum TaxID=301880 RepID=A0ABQ5B2I3_9ASTR
MFDSDVIALILSIICTNDNQIDQIADGVNVLMSVVALANLIDNLTLDTEGKQNDNQKQLKKANASLTQELKNEMGDGTSAPY